MDTEQDTDHPVDIAGLAADDHGAGTDAAPLLLVHGLTFDRSMWRGIVAELERIDPARRTVAIDLPGHGRSPDQPAYDLDTLTAQLHHVVEAAGLTAPVVVGHSFGGRLATSYAAHHPARGVVNIDQPLDAAPFATFVRALAERLRGPGFRAVWQMFYDSFHVELLPADAQDLVRSTSRARQQVVLGYWSQLLTQPTAELTAMIEQETAALRASGAPYLYITGDEPKPGYARWFGEHLPAATVEVWAHSGHFPHLVDPQRFARLLAGLGR
ncbi:alpha/beta fold hydrolase [Pseudonocardia xinjiangensis]|uniref:Alpha/beta hydrolase n=1 Tax=Pseudonocardia xinjiangensis TaxID=75289 RepID=A0ABX1RPB9_9PSEU|nr:alpha/beta hydrolase [Pseudonocardia xinjiangensis]NMH82246.1 alpha/beta hydrolase [Pseudonocardia xinjiangensis]